SSTPQNCCNSCAADPNCLGWAINKDNTQCFHCMGDVDTFCSSNKVDPRLVAGDGAEGGSIRCSDG
ncbi:2059_t:CDS:1, partial [Racocetra fulgida]